MIAGWWVVSVLAAYEVHIAIQVASMTRTLRRNARRHRG